MRKTERSLIIFVIIYLIMSSMYIGVCVNFEKHRYFEGYTETSPLLNTFRLIMGVPKVVKGYEGVAPKYLLEVLIKVIIAIILSIYLIIDNLKYKHEEIDVYKNTDVIKSEKYIKLLCTITKIIIIIPFIVIFLIYLYMTYYNVHSIR